MSAGNICMKMDLYKKGRVRDERTSLAECLGLNGVEDTGEHFVLGRDEAAEDDFTHLHALQALSLVLGQAFHRMSLSEAVADCECLILRGGFYHVATANTDFLAQCRRNSAARDVLGGADRVYCDGMPLVWISRLISRGLPERVAGSDLTPRLLHLCAVRGWRVFLFGSDEVTMARLRVELPIQYPGLQIVGAIAPPYGDVESWDNASFVEAIQEASPHVVLSAMGFPKQDLWIQRYLQPSVPALAIGVGASLDFLAGKQVRAPIWMQRSGLEWCWRMAKDPGRLVKRYAGDLWALCCLLARELPYFVMRSRTVRFSPVMNGIGAAFDRVVVNEGSNLASLHRRVVGSDQQVVVLDCVELHRPPLAICSELVGLAKAARNVGKVVAVYGGGSRLGSFLNAVGVDRVLPFFENPLALEAWISKQTSIFGGRTWTLRVPGNLTESRVRKFRECVREIAQIVWAEGGTLRLSLEEVNRVSLVAMLQLARWCEDFEGRTGFISLSGGTEQLREVFRIIGLEDYLEDAPLPLESVGPRDVSSGLDRAEVAQPTVEDEEEVVLGGEPLWD